MKQLLVLLLVLLSLSCAETFKLYKLEKGFEHLTLDTGKNIFEPNDIVFGNGENFYIISQKKSLKLQYDGGYTNSYGTFPVSDERIIGNIKYLRDIDLPSDTVFKPENQGIMQYVGSERKYQEVINTETTFILPRSEAKDAWGRAQVFVSDYSTFKIQVATNFIIETQPPNGMAGYGYKISKMPINNKVQFKVECIFSGVSISDNHQAKLNAKILSYYMKTGRLEYVELISK